ncbi:LysR substrate-binding domain-containing protein [Thalassomonas actiniarum]|uniref:LysR family transcriptional regulator n=1 Tax=Thalassomonas actiniarum TaxID=485447 RepID=A0AAF0C3F6_9GAMM|nr:LysR substrate-binding domain-containing protein [Thalassomonas actiniarum]WDE01152.1 LysR family transcriptional regulator [Thalassomonas actiniarum]
MDKRLKHLSLLRGFESAARHNSYSKAAEELFISQAAISQQMRQLEQALGVKLFMRHKRAMELTPGGETLYQASHEAFATLIQALNSIQGEALAGSLTITSTQSFASLWLMPRLYRFSVKHPEVSIKIAGSNHIEDLRHSHIDLAIRFGAGARQQTQAGLHCEAFGQEEVYPVCTPSLAAEMHLEKPQDILKCWLVNLRNARLNDWQIWFDEAGIENYQQHSMWTEVTSTDLALSAVLSGHGITLSSKSLFSQYVKTGQLVIPFDIKHPNTVPRYLVYDENSAKKQRLAVFINWLKEEMSAYESGA